MSPRAVTRGPGARALSVLTLLLGAAVAVSIVHYLDNVLAYDRYPLSETLPNPSPTLIAASWFVFTAFGVAGYLLYRRGRVGAGSACLAVYSGSGLVGIVHYLVPGVGDLAWWRHAHIGLDIACGVAILAFALWSVWDVGGRARSA